MPATAEVLATHIQLLAPFAVCSALGFLFCASLLPPWFAPLLYYTVRSRKHHAFAVSFLRDLQLAATPSGHGGSRLSGVRRGSSRATGNPAAACTSSPPVEAPVSDAFCCLMAAYGGSANRIWRLRVAIASCSLYNACRAAAFYSRRRGIHISARHAAGASPRKESYRTGCLHPLTSGEESLAGERTP